MSIRRSSLIATAATCCVVAVDCAGAESSVVYDPAELAAVASPILPCACPSSSCTNAPAPLTVPPGPAPATPSASASSTAPPAPPAFDASKPQHRLQGTVTGVSGKPAANAVVYLPDAPVVPGRGDSALVDQAKMLFIPFLSVIAVGGSVTFANSDPFPHNVYTTDHEKFNLGMVSQHARRAHAFKQSGAYRLLCNLHPNMLAEVFVSPSSYFGSTNGQGKYLIKDVPEGTHKVAVWAAGASADPQMVVVGAADATLDVSLHK